MSHEEKTKVTCTALSETAMNLVTRGNGDLASGPFAALDRAHPDC